MLGGGSVMFRTVGEGGRGWGEGRVRVSGSGRRGSLGRGGAVQGDGRGRGGRSRRLGSGRVLGWWSSLRAHHGFGEPDETGELGASGAFDYLPGELNWFVMKGGPPVHLLLHLPVDAVGVGDGMRIAAGCAAWWAAATLSGVLLRASCTARGLGGARGIAMSVALAFSAAEGEGIVKPSWVTDVVEVDGVWDVGGVQGDDEDGGGVHRRAANGDGALRRQLLSELGERDVLEQVPHDGHLCGVKGVVELEGDVVAGKCFGFQKGFCLLLAVCFEEDVLLALVGDDLDVGGARNVFHFFPNFGGRLLGYVQPNILIISNEVGACRVNFDSLVVGDGVRVHGVEVSGW